MITVETKPVRMSAVQWNDPRDGAELGVVPYRVGTETRYGLHTTSGMLPVRAGDWIVVLPSGAATVYSAGEFHQKFNVIEEG